MDSTIIPPTAPDPQGSPPPLRIRYHRIPPLTLYTSPYLHLADGVIEIGEGCAYLGQVRGAGPAFLVAGFLVAGSYAYPAPAGWQAAIVASSSFNEDGGGPEPPPTWAAPLRRQALAALRLAPAEVAA